MYNNIFGNTFDLNHDGKTDDFESMVEYHAIMNDVRQAQGIEKSMDEMSLDELNQSGIDLSLSGF